jgi:hypothetical protein
MPRRSSGTPARRGGSRRRPSRRGPAAFRMSTQRHVAARGRPARAARALWRRASLPATQRSGCGRPGKWCTGGSGANTTCCTPWRVAQPVGQRLARRHGAVRRHLVDDVVDAGDHHRHVGVPCSARAAAGAASAPWSGPTTPAAASARARRRRSASVRPAGRPAPRAGGPRRRRPPTSRRPSAAAAAGPAPTTPWRGPSASGRRGMRGRVCSACATSSGLSASLTVSDSDIRTC